MLYFIKIDLIYFIIVLYSTIKYIRALEKMFCKVCFDASKSGYNTHNVRDYASNVVCPLLLNTKCGGCGYYGHTTKYCKFGGGGGPAKKAPVVFAKSVAKVGTGTGNVGIKSKNMFAGMICSDVEEKEDHYDVSVMDFENDPIIWGVGLTSMVGKRWADVVGC
jgi:hypothetical protein